MDEKWTVFEESGTLYFCRSWTGMCIYKMVLGEGDTHDVYALPKFDRENFDQLLIILLHYRIGYIRIPVNVIPHGVMGNVIPCLPRSGMSIGLNGEKALGIKYLDHPGFMDQLFNPKDERPGDSPP